MGISIGCCNPRRSGHPRSDVGGQRSAVPQARKAARRRSRRFRDDRQRSDDPRDPPIDDDGQKLRRRAADGRAAGRLRAARHGRGGKAQRRPRGADHRHKFRLPGEKGGQRTCRLGADARRSSCRANPRSNGEGGRPAGHLEDAHGMGRAKPQRAAARPHRRSLRHPHDQRARPHPLPALCRLGRLEVHPPGQGSSIDPGHRQWRHQRPSTMPTGHWRNPAPTD